jgi:hypothetical protein
MLKSINDIANLDEVREKLEELLINFDVELNNYHTDIYLYFDEETKKATLSLFENPGGNSWINDDHYKIYTDAPHFESIFDYYGQTEPEEINYFAELLGVTTDALKVEAANFNNCDLEDVEQGEIELLIRETPEYLEKVKNDYEFLVRENKDCISQIDAILENFNRELEEREEERNFF